MKRGDPMDDEAAAILEIMRSVGILDFVMGKVKDQAELMRMFKTDFEGLMKLCQQ